MQQVLDGYRSHPPLPANDRYGEDYDEKTSVLGRSTTTAARAAPRALRIGSPTEQETSRSAAKPKRRREKQVVYSSSSDSEGTESDDDGMTLSERLALQDKIEAQKRFDEATASAAAKKAQATSSSSQGRSQAPPLLVSTPPRRPRSAAAPKASSTGRSPPPPPVSTDSRPAPISPAPEAAKRKAAQGEAGSQEQPFKKLRAAVAMKKAARYVLLLAWSVLCFCRFVRLPDLVLAAFPRTTRR